MQKETVAQTAASEQVKRHVVIALTPRGRTVTLCESLTDALVAIALSNMRGDARISVIYPDGECNPVAFLRPVIVGTVAA